MNSLIRIGLAGCLLGTALGSAQAQVLNVSLGSSGLEHMDLHVIEDQNGDGFDEILVGIPDLTNSRVEIRSGRNFQVLQTILAPLGEPTFGHSVCNVRDALAPFDGNEEIAIGAPGSEIVYVFDSSTGFTSSVAIPVPTTCPVASGTASDFGWTVEDIDSDGDGDIELAVGARRYSSPTPQGPIVDQGAIHVFDLQTSPPPCISFYVGPLGLSEVGHETVNVGDPDPMTGEELVTNYGGDAPGAIRVLNFSTTPATLIRATSINGAPGFPAPQSVFGLALATAPDYTNDGNVELIVGAPDIDFSDTRNGAAHAIPSANLQAGPFFAPVFSIVDPVTTGQSFGLAVSGFAGDGDYNGDGTADMIVAKSNWSANSSTVDGLVRILTIGTGTTIANLQAPGSLGTPSFGHDVVAYHQLPNGRQLIAVVDPEAGRLYAYR